MIQPIYLYGSEVLRARAQEADLSRKEELTQLITDLKDTLAVADGCGLAAPQIGVSQRVIIIDGTVMADVYDYLSDFKRVMINPVVLEESEKQCEYNEGCLSVPGVYADVQRPESMTVRYYDENFKEVTEKLDKFACRMVQHEMSHLDGVIFTDLVAPIRKKMLSKKLQNISHGKVSTRYKAKIR
ncbi:MAG: peptide deformylase [Bacteroidales bacterium]|nr:peptide deformylase [Bacteroidales bacterium]